MPFNVNAWEIMFIAIMFLVLFGPERLPEIAGQIGRLVREVRKASQAATSEIMREFETAARESGTSTAEIRDAAQAAGRTLHDTRRAIAGAVTAPIQAAVADVQAAVAAPAAAVVEAAPAPAGGADAPAADEGTAAEGRPEAVADDGHRIAPAGDGETAAPIDVDRLTRRIAPFDLGGAR